MPVIAPRNGPLTLRRNDALTRQLVAYLPFLDGSGDVVRSPLHDGIATGGSLTWTESEGLGLVDLPGNSDIRIVVPLVGTIGANFGSSSAGPEFTIAGWAQPDGLGEGSNGTVASLGTSSTTSASINTMTSTGNRWAGRLPVGGWRLYAAGTYSTSRPQFVALTMRYSERHSAHLPLVWVGDMGTPPTLNYGTYNAATGSTSDSTHLVVGAFHGGTYQFDGRIGGSVAVFDRALSANELTALWSDPWLPIRPRSWHLGKVPAGGPTTYYQSIAGSVTPAAALARQAAKPLTASTTPVGALARSTTKPLAAATAPTGELARALARTVTGTVAPAGSVVRSTAKALIGAVTPSGVLTAIRTILLAVTGTTTPDGTIVRQTGKTFGGDTTPTSAVTRHAAKPLAGATAPAGSVVRATAKTFAGSVTPTAVVTVIRAFLRTLTGSISPVGALARHTTKPIAGSVTPSATVTRHTTKTLTGTLTPTGGLLKQIRKTLTATIATAGALLLDHIPGGVQLRNWAWHFGPPRSRWSTAQSRARWSTARPSARWTTDPPDSRWTTGAPRSP